MDKRVDDIRLGARFSMKRLLAQLDYSNQLATSELEPLKTKGWSDARQNTLVGFAPILGAVVSEHEGVKDGILAATDDVQDALAETKQWKRSTLGWAGNAFDEAPATLSQFNIGESIGRSAPTMRKWLEKAIPLVEAHATAFTTEGAPADWAAQGKALKERLANEHGGQQLDIATLPKATADAYVKKAEAYRHLKRLNRVGRILHEGKATAAALYNLDILNERTPRKRKPTPTPDT